MKGNDKRNVHWKLYSRGLNGSHESSAALRSLQLAANTRALYASTCVLSEALFFFALTFGQFRFFPFLLAGKGNVRSGKVCEEFKSIAFTYWWKVNLTFNSPLNHNIRSTPLHNACKLVPRVYSAQNLPKIDRWRDLRLSKRIYMMARKWKNCVDFFSSLYISAAYFSHTSILISGPFGGLRAAF